MNERSTLSHTPGPQKSTRQTRGRLVLLAIAAAFALPIAAAAYLYFADTGWRPGAGIQYGILVEPPRALPDAALTTADQAPVLREVWSLLVLTGDSCDVGCRDALVKVRQVRLALGPKMTRMQMVLVPSAATTAATAAGPELRAEHPRLIVADSPVVATLRATIGAYNSGEIFLIDPFGNLMMRYPADSDMAGIRKDLGQLFKLSTIG